MPLYSSIQHLRKGGDAAANSALRDAARHVSPYKHVIRACPLRGAGGEERRDSSSSSSNSRNNNDNNANDGNDTTVKWFEADLNDDRQQQSGGGSLAGEVYYRARVSADLIATLRPGKRGACSDDDYDGGRAARWCPEELVRAVRVDVNGECVEQFDGAALRIMASRGQLVPTSSSPTPSSSSSSSERTGVDIVLPLGLCYPTAEPVPVKTRVVVRVALDARACPRVMSHELATTWLRREPASTAMSARRKAPSFAAKMKSASHDNAAWISRKVTRSAEVPASSGGEGGDGGGSSEKKSVVTEIPIPSPRSVLCEVTALVRGKGGSSSPLVASISVASPSGEKRQKLDGVFSGEVLPRRHFGVSGAGAGADAGSRSAAAASASWYLVPFEHLQDGITLRRAAPRDNGSGGYGVGVDEEDEDEEGDMVTASYFVCKLKVVLPRESDGADVVVMACFVDTLPLSSFPPQPAPPSRLPISSSSSSSSCPSSRPVFCAHDHDVCLVDACAATAADRSDRTTRGGGKDGDEEEECMGGGGGWCATDVVGDDGGWLPRTMLMSPPSSSSSMIVPVAAPPSSGYSISSPLVEVAKRLLPLLMGALAALLLVWLFLEVDAESDLAAAGGCPAGLMCEADTLSSELGCFSSSSSSTGLLETLLVPLGLGSGAAAFLSAGGGGGGGGGGDE